jgi:hypothetical protein
MIARYWRGWTDRKSAHVYEELLMSKIMPEIHEIVGNLGSKVMKRELGEEIEFATLTFWVSFDAIKEFAGEEISKSRIPEDAAALMSRWDIEAIHYETLE